MPENYVNVIDASKILDFHPETMKRLIREGKLTASKFGNKWIKGGTGSKCLPTPILAGGEG